MRLRRCCLILKLGPHPLSDRLALHHKVPVPVLPADMRESQKIERLWLPFSFLYPVQLDKSPELDPARFLGVQFQLELSQPFSEINQETVCIRSILATKYIVVGISHHHNIALRALLAARRPPRGRIHAARSLGEGLEETLTVHRLHVPPQLRLTLASTNVIESAFAIVERVCLNVKRWHAGDQRERWVGSGLLGR